MITKEENVLLTETGPGTLCGEFMRRYWQPVALADEMAPDGPPVPVRLLGEDLVLYRDGQGQLGLLGRWCSHRGADLAYGGIEDNGLRCGYHGWLYNVEGRCLEQPLEPPASTFHEQIHHRAYRVQERAGIVFAYLGPGDPPLLPAYEFFAVPDENRKSTKYFQECNYLQGTEGSLDPVQLIALQRILTQDPTEAFTDADEPEVDVEPEETSFGVRLVSTWETAPGEPEVEVRSFMLPSLCGIPARGINGYAVHWHVPIDDTHHWRFVTVFRRDGALSEEDARVNGVERTEEFRVDKSAIARYIHEREAAEPSSIAWTTMLAESQGAIMDRSQEHLAGSDRGIVAMRHVVYGAIQDVQEGIDPAHVIRGDGDGEGDLSGIEARQGPLPAGADWRSSKA